jgi:hypothetical protein
VNPIGGEGEGFSQGCVCLLANADKDRKLRLCIDRKCVVIVKGLIPEDRKPIINVALSALNVRSLVSHERQFMAESVSTGCMMGTASYAALLKYK